MKTETAYLAYNLVTQLERLRAETAKVKKHAYIAEMQPDQELGMSVVYDHTRGVDDNESIELDYHETNMFFQFLNDILRKREQNIEFEIDKLHPEFQEPMLKVLRVQYEQYQNFVTPSKQVHIDDMRLGDLPLIPEDVESADEVWIVQGDHQRRLK